MIGVGIDPGLDTTGLAAVERTNQRYRLVTTREVT